MQFEPATSVAAFSCSVKFAALICCDIAMPSIAGGVNKKATLLGGFFGGVRGELNNKDEIRLKAGI